MHPRKAFNIPCDGIFFIQALSWKAVIDPWWKMYSLVQNRGLDQNSIDTKNVCSLRPSAGYSLKKI